MDVRDLQQSGNLLLARIPSQELERFAAAAERVTLERDALLIEPNAPIRDVFFPIDALGSLVTVLQDGSTVEAGTVGKEGMVGVPVILDAGSTPMQTVVQIAGKAIRIAAPEVKKAFDAGGKFRELGNRYIHALFVIASQSAACNRRHQIEARLARWLLMSSDGIGSHSIGITHDFLGAMLGAQRSTVSETAQKLESSGLIESRRANVTILDRSRLEAASCECYGVYRREFDRLATA